MLLRLVLAGACLLALPATASAAVAPRSLKAPKLSGSAVAGRTLRSGHGTWSGHPTRYSYRWLRCDTRAAHCRRIVRHTRSRYRLAAADVGHRIRSEVTAKRGSRTRSKRSAPTRVVSAAPAAPAPVAPPVTTASGLRVVGNQLFDGTAAVRLRGVNKAGTEYACIQGWGIFDGPDDDASIAAIQGWKANVVRLPLNEDCWLAINGVPAQYAGANYQNAVRAFVDKLHARGMYAELSLMWGGPGTNKATYQPNAPDADHSPAFWAGLAAAYKDVPGVLLAPWGETTVSANCFLNGCSDEATFNGSTYRSAGMQEAVTAMRGAGYGGPIVIPGISYANDMSQWLSHKPSDPLGQLVAEAHLYGKNTCDDTACLDRDYAPVAAQVPLILGETGNTYDDSDCGSTSYISTFLNWADAHGVGYEAWTWNTWGTCGALITNDDGTPNGAYGTYVRNHLSGAN